MGARSRRQMGGEMSTVYDWVIWHSLTPLQQAMVHEINKAPHRDLDSARTTHPDDRFTSWRGWLSTWVKEAERPDHPGHDQWRAYRARAKRAT